MRVLALVLYLVASVAVAQPAGPGAVPVPVGVAGNILTFGPNGLASDSGGIVPNATTLGSASLGAGTIATITNGAGSVTASFPNFQGSARNELVFQNNASGLNTIGVQNTNGAGYGAYRVLGDDGVEHLAFGYCNSTTACAGKTYLEVSYFTGSSSSNGNHAPPDFLSNDRNSKRDIQPVHHV